MATAGHLSGLAGCPLPKDNLTFQTGSVKLRVPNVNALKKERETMKSKRLSAPIFAILAFMAFTTSASATTTEVGGVKQTGAVTVKASASGSILLTDTFGGFANTCKKSPVEGTTSTFTGTRVAGAISALAFEECTEDAKEKVVVDEKGTIEVENISGTTNGTVFSKNAKVTLPSPFGKLTCVTASTGTDIGKATGVASGNSTVDVSAAISCGIITAKFSGTYTDTSPTGLGSTS